MTLLKVENLTLEFDTDESRITAVDDVSFDLAAGEVIEPLLIAQWKSGLVIRNRVPEKSGIVRNLGPQRPSCQPRFTISKLRLFIEG